MIAQVYFKDSVIAIFPYHGTKIAELPCNGITHNAFDESLRAIKLQRRGRWQKTEWGLEAKVRFRK